MERNKDKETKRYYLELNLMLAAYFVASVSMVLAINWFRAN